MPATYRIKVVERDLSGFASIQSNEIGAIVVKSKKGPSTPILCTDDQAVILHFGTPDATNSGVLDVISYCRYAPAWVVSKVGTGATFAGIDVETAQVTAYGNRAGRVDPDNIDFSNIEKNTPDHSASASVDGLTAQFTGTLTNTVVKDGSLQLKIAGTVKAATDAGGDITGTDIGSASTINYASGEYDFTFNGSIGTVASLTSTIDLVSDVDLSGVASAGVASISSSPTQFIGATECGLTSATYDLDITVDSTLRKTATALLIDDTWAEVATKIETALQVLTSSSETVAVVGGKITVSSVTSGTSSTITIVAGTTGSGGGDLLTAIDALTNYNPTLDTPIDGENVGINVTIDDQTAVDVDLGSSATTTRASIISAINVAVGDTVASANDSGGEFIDIVGLIGSATSGGVSITSPGTTLQNGVAATIDAGSIPITADAASNSPTNAVPQYGEAVIVDYIYTQDLTNVISHTICAASPYDDAIYQLAGQVEYLTGTQYKLTLYEVVTATTNREVNTYTYSLTRENDNFGKSLYIDDVFLDNAYVIPVVNTDYAGATADPTVAIVDFTGGERGTDPQGSHALTAWNNFQRINKYQVTNFLDIYGDSATTLQTLLQTYHPYAFGLTCVDFANDASGASGAGTARTATGIDYDNMSISSNWCKVEDPYNDSFAWISNVGAVAAKYALMENVYDGLSPAGVDENSHGGQLAGFKVVDTQNYYTQTDLQTLNEAQINPIVLDDAYGPIVEGDNTLQVSNSDTSFVGTRRMYNLLIKNIIKQVLRKQVFKLNDELHRDLAKNLTDSLLAPVLAQGLIAEALVQCDFKNNDSEILNARKFILDVYVKVTPNSQFVQLNFTRLSQTQTIAQFV